MVPPFGTYGGQAMAGNRTTVSVIHNFGGNTLVTPPSFNLTTGFASVNQTSFNQQGGRTGMESWVGANNLSFLCSGTCGTGSHHIAILWNLSWDSYVGSNCSRYYSSGTWARTSVMIQALVYNTTNGRFVLTGTANRTVSHQALLAPGFGTSIGATKNYRLGLNVSITSGGSYVVETLVLVNTWTHSLPSCGSYSGASVGTPTGSSGLRSIRVY